MIRRRLLVVVPALATSFVAVVLLGPGRERTALAARVLAAGAPDGGVRAVRLETVYRARPFQEPAAVGPISVHVDGAEAPIWTGSTDAHGLAEIRFDPPLLPGAAVTVRGPSSVLASAPLEVPPAPAPVVAPAVLVGSQKGELVVSAAPVRGPFVPSLTDEIRFTVRDADGRPVAASLSVELTSTEPDRASLRAPDGAATLALTVVAPPASVKVRADAGGREGELEATLPVAMGATWVAPTSSSERLDLVSPAPRDAAYVSLYDATGRIGGGVAALSASPDGYHRGHYTLPEGVDLVGVVVSSDAHEAGASTVAWPPPGRSGYVDAPRLAVAIDGMPSAVAAEKRRVSRVRILATLALSLAAAIEISLLLWTRREAKAEIEKRLSAGMNAEETSAHFADDLLDEAGLPRDRSAEPLLVRPVRESWTVVGVVGALVLLAFAATLGLVVMR